MSNIVKRTNERLRRASLAASVIALTTFQSAVQPAMAQLPAPPTPSDGAADGNILQLTNNSAKDLTDVAAVIFLVLISFGFIAAIVWKFIQWRQNRAELGDVAMVGGVGAIVVGIAAVILNNATGYITAI